MSCFRTDLASEAHILSHGTEFKKTSVSGLSAREDSIFGFPVCCVDIAGRSAAEAIGKPIGKYFTLSLPENLYRSSASFSDAVSAVAELIRRCMDLSPKTVLVAALGNPDITPDAVGPLAAQSVLVTRHMKERSSPEFASFSSVALCRTGVLGTTGIESAVQIRTLCRELGAELVIAVDALACAEAENLCRTVQICSSGIAPGSGVGNNREKLDREFLGVPVVAVGVPTVMDASVFSGSSAMQGMFVTPRSIDSQVRDLGRIIGYGIDLALHKGLTVADIDLLVS